MLLALNPKCDAIFRKLIEGLTEVGDHKTIDNAPGTFMRVVVEVIGRPDFGARLRPETKLVSVAHYHEVNGDLCQDPEVVFLVNDKVVYPCTFQQAIPAVHQEAVAFEDGKIKYNERAQQSLTLFCCEWLINVQDQQGL